jgi:LacI family transcriptional regulator
LRAATAGAGAELVELRGVQPRFDGGVAAADPVLATGVTAVIAYNDVIALGLLSRFNTRGTAVPATISVIGFDDIPLAAMVHPSLTTVGLPMESCGRAGVDLLLGLLQNKERFATTRRELGTQLMVRASTGPPPNV